MTEEELSASLSKYNNQYDVTENNCWHYSHLVTNALNAKTDPHPYLLLIKGLSSFMSPVIKYDDFKSFSKSISEFLVN